MSENAHDNLRLAKNSLALFIRMAILMLISLYTSRVILKALGVTDFGIVNVVGGFVSMFSIISNSLSASISRYITVALGQGDLKKLSSIFSTSLNMLYIICLLLIIVLETLGLWFVNYKMLLPSDRLTATNWVFQICIATFIIEIVSMPYNALIISHERMAAFAYIGILEALGKLCVAFLVIISPFDRMIFYALLLAIIALSIRVIYGIYCHKNFPESHYCFVINKPLIKEIFGFSGWNFFGVSSSVLADQGVNMMLNVFFGPTLNAARSIAMQVNTAVGSFCGSFTTAVNPQLTKSYAAGEKKYYLQLCDKSVRFSFYLYFIIALPVTFTAPLLLHLWLGIVPDHTINFVRLVLLYSLISIISSPLVTLLLATGNIKIYQLWVGGFRYIILPICWFFLWLGAAPEIVFFVTIGTEICCLILRLIRLKIQIQFPIYIFVKRTLCTIIIVTLISLVLPVLVNCMITSRWLNIITIWWASIISVSFTVYQIGINKKERDYIKEKVSTIFCAFKLK